MIKFNAANKLKDHPTFNAEDVVHGLRPKSCYSEEDGRVSVEVDGVPDSLCIFGSMQGEESSVPLVYLEGDAVSRGNYQQSNIVVGAWYSQLSPYLVQIEAEEIARAFRRPFINLARPGVFGSSGFHNERRREREVSLVDAALDRLMTQFGWQQFDIAGQSGGGHLVASLIARRTDIRCAVIASGNVAVRRRNEARGMSTDATGFSDFVDPIDLVDSVAQHPPAKIIVLTDPEDATVLAQHQIAYVDCLRAAGVSVEHRMVRAHDANHHILRFQAMLAAASLN